MNNSNATSTSYTGFYNTGSTATIIKNNIFSVLAGSYTPMYLATSPTGNIVNYNIYYNAASSTLLYRGGNFTPATYKTATAGGDTSYNMVPPFVSSTNFNITNGCIRGDASANVSTDYTGAIRGIPGNIGAYEYPGVSIDITPTAILSPSFPVSLGSQDLRVLVRNNGNSTITSFDLSYQLNGSAAVSTSFSGTLASCDTVSVYFTGTQQINLVNSTNNIRVYTSNPNAGADGYAANDTMNQSLSTPMSGTYIIGTTAPSDFPTFNAAVSALQLRGVAAPVEFKVRTGTYVEAVNVQNIVGLSASSNVVFNSMANHRDSVTLQFNTLTGGIGYVLRLASSYVTFRNMGITQLSDQATVIDITGTIADTIDNCKVTGQTYSTTSSQYLIKANGAPTDSLVIRNSLLQGYTYYGLYIYQTSTATANRNTVIENNTIQNMGYTYITYLYYTSGLKFRNNTLTAGTGTTSGYLYFYYNNDGFNFTNNKITMDRTTNYTYLGYYSLNTASNRGLIANNVFNYTATSGGGTPYLGYASNYLSYLNNTFRSTNATYGVGYYVNYSCTDFEFKNNIVYSTTQYAMNWYQLPSNNKIDNNTYYTPNAVFLNMTSPATTYANIQAYKIATMSTKADHNSISFDPGFTSTTNLVPSATNANAWSVNGRAAHDARVTTDFNNVARPATLADGVPDVGAYEFTPTSTPPLATAVPTTPVAGGTQSFLFGGDTIAKITYDAFATAPTSMGMRVYSGVTPPLIGTATAYPYFYVSTVAPTGTYTYNARINFKRIWMGTLPTVADLKFAAKAPANPWIVLVGTNSIVDSVANTITALSSLSDLPSVFTAADDLNPLPVEMIKFSGVKVENTAHLNWATATEVNSSRFEIEASYDGKNFNYIGKVKSNGNSNSLKNYSFVDEKAFVNNEPVVYYRLKLVDLDGTFDYSSVITVNNSETEPTISDVNVFPNPFNDKVYLELNLDNNQTVELRDVSGRLVYSQELSASNQLHELAIPSNVNKGVYFLVFGNGNTKSVKLVRN